MGADQREWRGTRLVRRLATGASLLALLGVACSKEATAPVAKERPEAMLIAIRDMLVQEDPVPFWESLPASYQAQANALLRDFVRQMDPELWNRGSVLAGKALQVLSERQDLLVGHAWIGDVVQSERRDFDEIWGRTVRFLSRLYESDLRTLDQLRSTDLDRLLRRNGDNLVGLLTALADLFPGSSGLAYSDALHKLESAQISVLDRDGEHATVRVNPPAEAPEDFPVIRREGKWVLRPLADNWDLRLAQAQIMLARFRVRPEDRERALGRLDEIESALDRLLEASNSTDFRQALDEILERAPGLTES